MPINSTIASEQWFRFQYCTQQGHYKFLEKADRCEHFFAGEQWSETDLNMLQLQKRPALTINKIISTMSNVMGEQIYNRNEVLFRPSTGGNANVAEALTKVWMQIAQKNQLSWVRSDVFADGIIRSRGFYDVRLEFNDALQGEVQIAQLNSKKVVIDPDAEEYDPDSWNDCFITKWLTYQDIATLYDEGDAEFLKDRESSLFPYSYDSIERVRDRFAGEMLTGSYYGLLDSAHVRRNIRVLERQYRKLDSQKHFVDTETGDMRPVPEGWDRERIGAVLQKAGPGVNIIKKKVKRIRWTVTADNLVLHDDWSPYKHFTPVPYFPHFRYGKTIGLVENLISPQELLNKVSSQELHVVNTTANSGWKLKAGSLRNMNIEDLEEVGAQSGLVLELEDIAHAEKIQPNQTPQGLDRIGYKADENIKGISGVSDSMQGFDREDVAAKAISYKTQNGAKNLTKVLDNLERTDWILARNVLDIVQEYYTEERLIHITHDDVSREPETLTINQHDANPDEILNDLTLGEYDIVITSTPERATMEDSQFEQAKAMREIGVQIPDSVLIENSRLMRRAEIVKQMSASADSPEAKAAAALKQRHGEATVAKLEAEVTDKDADSKLKIARAQKEEMEASGDGGAAAELRKVELDHELQMQKMDREFQLKGQAQEQELRLKEQAQAQELDLKRQMHAEEVRHKNEAAEQAALAVRATAAAPEKNT
jgi:hypothetical protein